MKKNLRLLATLLFLAVFGGIHANVIDELTYDKLGLPTATSYGNFDAKTFVSNAVYAGNASSGGNKFIQLRSNNSNSGIITTASGGKLVSVTLTFNSATLSSRTVDVYGSNTAYTSASELYSGGTQGTKIGSLTFNGTSNTVALTISGDYTYIGLRSNSGALYLDNISIEWDNAGVAANLSVPTISGTNPFMGTTSVTLTNTAATGELYYTIDGTEPTSASTKYTGPFTLDHTATVKAIADDGTAKSLVAEQYFMQTTGDGTVENPYTVEDAMNIVNQNFQSSTVVHVKGIISQIDKVDVTAGNAQYWISDDGTTASQLEAYNGLFTDGAKFTSADQIALGYKVVIKGVLKLFNKIIELDAGNSIVSLALPDVFIPEFENADPFVGSKTVSLTNPNTSGNIYYTTDGTDPTTASTLYEAPFTIAATTTVKAVVVDGANRSVVTSAVFFKTDHAGTQDDPYTAAEAYDMITGGVKLSQDVYVKGIVYSSNNLSSGTITYYITPDGSSTNQVQVYNGKSFDGADFTNTDNVGKGDEVVVKGGFLYYNNTRAEIINSQLVSIVKAPIAVTFGPSGYASLYYSGLNLTVPSGVVASGYKLSTANTLVESVTWTAGEVIPAGTAVLMQAAEGTYDFVVAESATKTDAENILLGTDGNTTPAADANAYFYKFALDNNGQNPGFYWGEATGATFKMSAHKAYLKVAKSAGAKTVYGFGHEATGISRLPVDGSAANGPVYNMAGQRVDASYKGLIIRNGKKMIRR
jgi:hypothetical protein